jgi:hypothetical protein
LIKFDEDLADLLVINIDKYFQGDAHRTYFKHRLLCKYYEYFNFISIFDKDASLGQLEIETYLLKTGLKSDFFNLNDFGRENFFQKFFKISNPVFLNSFVSLMRNSFKQNSEVFKMNGNLKIIQWKFELSLYYYSKKQASTAVGDESFSPSRLRDNLLNQMKHDLSQNRTNTKMWLQYAVVKYLVNKLDTADCFSVPFHKELRKIIDNLLLLNSTDYLQKLNICLAFIELSLCKSSCFFLPSAKVMAIHL